MAQLSSIISTQDAQFRTAVTAVLRSSGTSVSIVEERGDGATTPDLAIVDARTGASALAVGRHRDDRRCGRAPT